MQREKNRRAQNLFRARKEAAQVEQDSRISQLEEVIDKLGSAFATLSERVLQSSLAKTDPHLCGELRNSIQDVLALTRYHTHPPTGEDLSGSGNEETQSAQSFDLTPLVAEPITALLPELWNASNGMAVPDRFSQAAELNYIQTLNGNSQIPRNVFTNGWLSTLPLPYTSSAARGVQGGFFGHDLTNRIVHSTLFYVYHILHDSENSSSGLANEIFNHSLKAHSREELLYNIRWFLGPGQGEMHRLSTAGTVELPTLNPIVDVGALGSIGPHTESDMTHRHLLTAHGVEEYLTSRMVRRVDEDTLEIWGAADADGAYEDQPADLVKSASSNFFNMDLFFPSTPSRSEQEVAPRQVPLDLPTVRFSESIFLRGLANSSLCLTYGPSYRMDRIKLIIREATTDVF